MLCVCCVYVLVGGWDLLIWSRGSSLVAFLSNHQHTLRKEQLSPQEVGSF